MRCDVIAEGVVAAVKEVGLASTSGSATGGHQCRTRQKIINNIGLERDRGR